MDYAKGLVGEFGAIRNVDDAIYLYGLLEKEIQTARLDGNSEEHCDIHADGVNHGLETVIAMFVECHDELVLSQLES
jgi:hypothetical protein